MSVPRTTIARPGRGDNTVRRADGTVVGRVIGSLFVKHIVGSKHLLRKPPAIAFGVDVLAQAKALGATEVAVEDTEAGTVYRATIGDIEGPTSLEFDRGHGLPVEVLNTLGWQDTPEGVAIPWPGGARHIRRTLERDESTPRWAWRDKARASGPYGYDRLPAGVEEAVITESEADAVALWSARIAAVATGGADGWRAEWWRHLTTLRRVTGWAEDAGTLHLARALLRTRPANGPEVLICSPLWQGTEKDAARILVALNGAGATRVREIVASARPAQPVPEGELPDALLGVLGGHWTRHDETASGRCPFHDDRSPSLSIFRRTDRKGRPVWRWQCHGGNCIVAGTTRPLAELALALGLVPIRAIPGQEFDSSAYKSGPADETNFTPSFTFRSAADLVAASPEDVPWLWEGYVAEGALTLFGGREKSGKSTLTFSLLRSLLDGSSFLGQSCMSAPVVLLSEEPDAAVKEKLERFGLAGETERLSVQAVEKGGRFRRERAEIAADGAAYDSV